MVLYASISFFYFLCIQFEERIGKRFNRKFWTLLLILPLLILSSLRAPTVGSDTLTYYYNYSIISKETLFSEITSRMEIGYVLLIRVFGTLEADFILFQIFITTFILFSIAKLIYRYSSNIAMSIFIFLTLNMFFGSMNISRQYIAVAIITYSIQYIVDRKFIKFFIIILLASSFHTTAIFFIFIYFIVDVQVSRMKKVLIIVLGIITSVGFDYFVRLFTSFVGKYEGYLEGEYFTTDGNIAIYLILAIYFLFFMIAVYTRYGKFPVKSKEEVDGVSVRYGTINIQTIWYGAALLTFLCGLIGLNTTIMSRVALYFSIFHLIYIPDVLNAVRNKYIKFLLYNSVIIGLFLYYCLILMYRPEWTSVIPYNWYWNW